MWHVAWFLGQMALVKYIEMYVHMQCSYIEMYSSLILLWTIEHTMKHLSINATFRPSRASSGMQKQFCMPDEARDGRNVALIDKCFMVCSIVERRIKLLRLMLLEEWIQKAQHQTYPLLHVQREL